MSLYLQILSSLQRAKMEAWKLFFFFFLKLFSSREFKKLLTTDAVWNKAVYWFLKEEKSCYILLMLWKLVLNIVENKYFSILSIKSFCKVGFVKQHFDCWEYKIMYTGLLAWKANVQCGFLIHCLMGQYHSFSRNIPKAFLNVYVWY